MIGDQLPANPTQWERNLVWKYEREQMARDRAEVERQRKAYEETGEVEGAGFAGGDGG